MATHKGHLKNTYYEAIKKGLKIYEVRVNDDKRKKIKEGDEWIFENDEKPEQPKLITKIAEVKTYKTFEEAIKETGVSKLLPEITSDDVGIEIYESFEHDEGTYKKGAEKFGVVRFKLDVIR